MWRRHEFSDHHHHQQNTAWRHATLRCGDTNSVPITGATVSLFAMGTTGYGSTPALLASATSDAKGNFSFGKFSCPSAIAQTYLTAAGGNGGAGNNVAIALITAAGPCGKLGAFVTVNELTSAASAYALQQFINRSNPMNIGAPVSNVAGLNNAVATVANLADIVTGLASNFLQSGGNSPQQLNSLADILYACDSSSGPSSSACSTLFLAATPPGGVAPGDVLQALMNIVENPSLPVPFGSIPPNPPFSPVLVFPPNDWTMVLSFPLGTLAPPQTLAIDALGNVWISNPRANIIELSPLGSTLSPTGGFTGGGLSDPFGIGIDQNGNVWVSNRSSSVLSELNSSGAPVSPPTGFIGGGLGTPQALAIDQSANVWVINVGGNGSLSEFASTGVPLSPSTGVVGAGCSCLPG